MSALLLLFIVLPSLIAVVVGLEVLVVALAISGVVTLWLRVIKILREFQVTKKPE